MKCTVRDCHQPASRWGGQLCDSHRSVWTVAFQQRCLQAIETVKREMQHGPRPDCQATGWHLCRS